MATPLNNGVNRYKINQSYYKLFKVSGDINDCSLLIMVLVIYETQPNGNYHFYGGEHSTFMDDFQPTWPAMWMMSISFDMCNICIVELVPGFGYFK